MFSPSAFPSIYKVRWCFLVRTVHYCLHGLLTLIRRRPAFHLCCLLISAVVFAATPFLFSSAMQTWSDEMWEQRVAKVTFCENVSARELYERLANHPQVNGYLMNLDVQQQGNEHNTVTLNAVSGVLYEQNQGSNALLGSADTSDEDIFLLRSIDVPNQFILQMDEMTVLIDGQPFESAGLSKAIGANYANLPSNGQGMTVVYNDEDGSPALFQSELSWGSVVLIPSATAARHDFPVSALEISFVSLDANEAYQSIIAPYRAHLATEQLPWSTAPLTPSFHQLPINSIWNLLSEVMCLLSVMVLLLLWLSTFGGAVRVFLLEGAGTGRCGFALFLLGLMMLLLSMVLGYGFYLLLLPLGERLGIMTWLPLNVLSLIGVIFIGISLCFLVFYCRRCVRIAARKGACES